RARQSLDIDGHLARPVLLEQPSGGRASEGELRLLPDGRGRPRPGLALRKQDAAAARAGVVDRQATGELLVVLVAARAAALDVVAAARATQLAGLGVVGVLRHERLLGAAL